MLVGLGAAVVAPLGWLAAQSPGVLTPSPTPDLERAEELRAQTLALMGTLVYGTTGHQIELAIHLAHAEALTRALGESEVPEPSRTFEPVGTLVARRTALRQAAARFALQADSGEYAALFSAIAASLSQLEAADL